MCIRDSPKPQEERGTHYKRAPPFGVGCGCCAEHQPTAKRKEHPYGSVSYTHLDVYKRQVDGYGLQAGLPGLNVGLHDVFDGGFLGHVDGLADRAGKERLRRRHHLQMAAPSDRASALGRK